MVTKEEVSNLIKTGEGYTLEFKEAFNRGTIAKELCAFANASGGKILLGVSDIGHIKKYTFSNEDRSALQLISRQLDPSINVQSEQVGDVTILFVPEGKEKPYASSGAFYLRQGASSQKLNRDEIREFFQKENLLRFDRKANLKFDMNNDFDTEKYGTFIQRIRIDTSLSQKHVLENLGLITDGKLNNTGVLFFSHRISKFFFNAVIACVLYAGKTKEKILDKKEFDADFVSNFQNTLLFLAQHLRTEYVISGAQREEKQEISEEILRELVINAMVHRDYYSEGRVLVEIFEDRVEISNPGKLLIKRNDLGRKSLARSPLLVDIAHRLRFVERIGSGISRVISLLKQRVSFDIDDNWFRVIIRRDDTVNDTEKNILDLLQKDVALTYDELAKKMGKSRSTIIRAMNRLKQKQKVVRIGSDKNGFWKVLKQR